MFLGVLSWGGIRQPWDCDKGCVFHVLFIGKQIIACIYPSGILEVLVLIVEY